MNRSQETPEQKIKRLEKELKDERLRNLLINEMVDIMNWDYGADLRKKYLSKEHAASKMQSKLEQKLFALWTITQGDLSASENAPGSTGAR